MKIILCYFSCTGNTKLACEYIAGVLKEHSVELFDMTIKKSPDFTKYDLCGFAAFTDYYGPSKLFEDFMASVPKGNWKRNAFVFNTHAGASGKTLLLMRDYVYSRGYNVVAAASLTAPVNFPPQRVNPNDETDINPNPEMLEKFNKFISQLSSILEIQKKEEAVPECKIVLSEEEMNWPYCVRIASREDMGLKKTDEKLCTRCGVCVKKCPYAAIELKPYPVFNQKKCYGCWRCYNICPTKAIYTKKVKNNGHYPAPAEEYKKKLRIK
ncbi:MAG: hypothetical protein A2044_05465 [Candidatus Firestonebacteria bacterium GWA2_43_8]|nr:MAG: hypothetical protein A2044_05465 [Candidatus Firestonebacteria bacterium GWA2_43_8]